MFFNTTVDEQGRGLNCGGHAQKGGFGGGIITSRGYLQFHSELLQFVIIVGKNMEYI